MLYAHAHAHAHVHVHVHVHVHSHFGASWNCSLSAALPHSARTLSVWLLAKPWCRYGEVLLWSARRLSLSSWWRMSSAVVWWRNGLRSERAVVLLIFFVGELAVASRRVLRVVTMAVAVGVLAGNGLTRPPGAPGHRATSWPPVFWH